jgi:hypothetical protein
MAKRREQRAAQNAKMAALGIHLPTAEEVAARKVSAPASLSSTYHPFCFPFPHVSILSSIRPCCSRRRSTAFPGPCEHRSRLCVGPPLGRGSRRGGPRPPVHGPRQSGA